MPAQKNTANKQQTKTPSQQPVKAMPSPAKQNEAPKQSQASKAAPVVTPQQAVKPAPMARKTSLTAVQQQEQQQILNILIDDAGKDWKPRVKSTTFCIPGELDFTHMTL
ncbi:Aste57867_1235 [Aphanomyces stellatus]|uniref:Aste57867_1235 protein n=1 Tax=Aphanomyces stellatus TaxID=120398 RepID=A0A485K818_9STRA|nr:hypothetical protein As57867_001234 [Aphanomyces stellatus]VFT78454.1 Aste57867_1235 [Aphanomyces stellatus]